MLLPAKPDDICLVANPCRQPDLRKLFPSDPIVFSSELFRIWILNLLLSFINIIQHLHPLPPSELRRRISAKILPFGSQHGDFSEGYIDVSPHLRVLTCFRSGRPSGEAGAEMASQTQVQISGHGEVREPYAIHRLIFAHPSLAPPSHTSWTPSVWSHNTAGRTLLRQSHPHLRQPLHRVSWIHGCHE